MSDLRTFFRSILGTFLPLAGPPLYTSLGLGWGNSVLGFIAVALVPIPILLYRYNVLISRLNVDTVSGFGLPTLLNWINHRINGLCIGILTHS